MALAKSTMERDDVAKVFQRFDFNGDGRISAAELRAVVDALGAGESTSEDVQKMMEEMDTDRDGFVDLEEFTAFFAQHGGGGAAEQDTQLMDAFRVYDQDGNGKISAKELHRVMQGIGEKCSVRDCARMIKSVDADGDGCVDFGEFKRMMTGEGKPICKKSPFPDKRKR